MEKVATVANQPHDLGKTATRTNINIQRGRYTNAGKRLSVALKPWLLAQARTSPSTSTPPKTNMEPETDGFQKESPFPGVYFQVPC